MKKRKIIFGTLAVIAFVAIFIAYKFFGPAVQTPSGEFFYIPTGSTYNEVREELLNKKFIGSPTWFNFTSRVLGYSSVKPGRYKLTKGMSMVSLVRMLRAGRQKPVDLVITKVRTREALAARTGKLFECDSAQMIAFLNNPDSLRQFGVDTNNVIALAMPLTYKINWNATPGKIVQQWATAYKVFWNDKRKQQADSLHLTPLEVMTLASIVDEESNKKDDKLNIASVYLNRLQKGMNLQSCPTIKYALHDFTLRRILNVHLQTKSPYNTYINKGLPPGPICTPMQATIDEVLNAPQTDYLYFVASSNFDGSSIFTTNYSDHMKYAKLYQDKLPGYLKSRDSLARAKSNQ